MKRTTWWQRWRSRFVGGAVLLAGAGGCKQPVFLDPADWKTSLRPGVPSTLEERPHDPILPGSLQAGALPATVKDFARQQRPISLKEAFAVAAEQGNVGSQGLNGQDNFGQIPSFAGGPIKQTDTIKAFVYDPAFFQAEAERALSRFDARLTTSMTWAKQDQATLSLQQSFSNGDSATLNTTLAKPLPTGGLAGITTSVAYQKLAAAPTNQQFVTLGTSYTPRVQFLFEQPLLQGFGVEANQLLGAHPLATNGSLLAQGLRPTGSGEGILITRLRAEQGRKQLDVSVNQMLLNVESAYWNLFSAYYNLHSQQKGLAQALSGYLYYLARANAALPGDDLKGVDAPYLVSQAESQYHTFKLQVLQARADVLNADRNLRGLLGMKSDDGTVFVPTDEPTRTPQQMSFPMLWQETVQSRPELTILRQDVKAQQLALQSQKILRLPDVRAFASYDVNGLGSGLSGPQLDAQGRLNNALANLASNQFNSWQLGLRADIPIGFRDADAQVRKQQLDVRRAWAQLVDGERKAYEFLVDAYRQMEFAQERMKVARANKLALQQQAERLEGRVQAGINTASEFINTTQAQRELAQRTADEFRAVADYNIALARVEYAKGTIQQYAGVTIADGALPAHVQKKAADHFRARAAALKLRDHPASSYGLLQQVDLNAPIPALPAAAPAGTPLPGSVIPGAPLPGSVLPGPALPTVPPAEPLPTTRPLTALPSPPPVAPTPATVAPSTVRRYEDWKPLPGGSATSVPSSLPPALGTLRSPAEDPPGNPVFRKITDVTLPTRGGAEPPK